MQRVGGFAALSSKWEVFIKFLLSRFRDLYKRGGRKLVRAAVTKDSKKARSTFHIQ